MCGPGRRTAPTPIRWRATRCKKRTPTGWRARSCSPTGRDDTAKAPVSLYSEARRIGVSLPILRAWRLSRLAVCNDSAARRPTLVEPGIWIGGIPSQRRWRELRAAGVTAAVCLLMEEPPPRWTADVEQLLWL